MSDGDVNQSFAACRMYDLDGAPRGQSTKSIIFMHDSREDQADEERTDDKRMRRPIFEISLRSTQPGTVTMAFLCRIGGLPVPGGSNGIIPYPVPTEPPHTSSTFRGCLYDSTQFNRTL
jgi:hypothetical protein